MHHIVNIGGCVPQAEPYFHLLAPGGIMLVTEGTTPHDQVTMCYTRYPRGITATFLTSEIVQAPLMSLDQQLETLTTNRF